MPRTQIRSIRPGNPTLLSHAARNMLADLQRGEQPCYPLPASLLRTMRWRGSFANPPGRARSALLDVQRSRRAAAEVLIAATGRCGP